MKCAAPATVLFQGLGGWTDAQIALAIRQGRPQPGLESGHLYVTSRPPR